MHAKTMIFSCAVLICTAALPSCDALLGVDPDAAAQGELRWHFGPSTLPDDPDAWTKAGDVEIPDTNDFLLTIRNASGKILYDGSYGASPASLLVDPGSYTLSVRSCEFSTPAFSRPQFGDEQVLVVKKGQLSRALLHCTQLNAGIRLKIAPSFLEDYPGASLFVKSAEGKLLYSYSEKRVAYFLPGTLSLIKSEGGRDETLFSRQVAAQQILSVSIATSGSASGKNGFQVEIDTARTWLQESFTLGGEQKGGNPSGAYSVLQARDHVGEEAVWVYGYVVGGDLSSSGSKMNTTAPFSSDTHLALAERSSVTDKASCLSVELKKGDLRSALNLKDHPELLGRQLFLKGTIASSYYGIPGLKNVSEWEIR